MGYPENVLRSYLVWSLSVFPWCLLKFVLPLWSNDLDRKMASWCFWKQSSVYEVVISIILWLSMFPLSWLWCRSYGILKKKKKKEKEKRKEWCRGYLFIYIYGLGMLWDWKAPHLYQRWNKFMKLFQKSFS